MSDRDASSSDVRLGPELGTTEVRAMDAETQNADVAARDAAPYRPPAGFFDEGIGADGHWRPEIAAALAAVAERDPRAAATAAAQAAERAGLTFVVDGGTEAFLVDPIPRVLTAAEWAQVKRGVAQRTRALDAFVADVHGPRRTIAEGVVPQRLLDGATHHEEDARRLPPPGGVWIGVSGLDVVRGADGRFAVLEDNVRTPSGIAYTMATREIVREALDLDEVPARPLDDAVELLRATLEGAAPPAVAAAGREPALAVLTDGPSSPAFWEHGALATGLGAALVTAGDLALDGDRLTAHGEPVDVVYRRTDDASLHAPAHRLLRTALAAQTIGVINGFGTGVADDKLTHAYVEELIRFLLDEEPELPSVRTLDLGRPRDLEEALDRLDELVVKPRDGAGGDGVVICAHAQPADVDALRRDVRAAPEQFVAQELVALSTHPTVVGDHLEPRHVDLRPFAFLTPGRRARVFAGGLTRVALREGSMVVNSSQDGGAKDTWILP